MQITRLIIVLSGLFAHAPARLRDYAWGRKTRVCGTRAIEEHLK